MIQSASIEALLGEEVIGVWRRRGGLRNDVVVVVGNVREARMVMLSPSYDARSGREASPVSHWGLSIKLIGRKIESLNPNKTLKKNGS